MGPLTLHNLHSRKFQFFFFFLLVFQVLYLGHMEVPRLGVKSELQQLAYAEPCLPQLMATPDP